MHLKINPFSARYSNLSGLLCAEFVSLAEHDRTLNNTTVKGVEDTADTEAVRTTVFVEDGNQRTNTLGSVNTTDNLVIRDQSICDFMAKPLLVRSGTWTTSDVQMTNKETFSISNLLTTNTVWSQKYAGFNLVRGTAIVRLQINCNPFQQGLLYMGFLPNATQASSTDINFVPGHTSTLSAFRQIPGVELDCREATAILRIPYIAPTHFYDIKNNFFDWGSVYLNVISPLQTGAAGQNTVEYSIYLSFEDFELSAPSVAQGASSKKKYKAKTFKTNPTLSEEKEFASGKPVSGVLAATSKFASSMSAIPMLAPIAEPVAWASGVASKIAGYLGWSKPTLMVAPQYMSKQYNRHMPNADGADISYKMSCTSTNQLAMTDNLTISEHDEMSIDFLKMVPTIVPRVCFTWNVSDVIGTSLVNAKINPGNIYEENNVTHGAHTATYRCGPPIFHLARCFQYARGGLKLVLKFVKTDYHTGRVMITWTPANSAVTPPVYNGNSQIALRHIVDIREGDTVCLELPYLFGTNYLPIDLTNTGWFWGQLDIKVINILRAPETCSNNINVLGYLCAAEDFEFAGPSTRCDPAPFYPQIGEVECNGIGGSTIPPESTHFAEMSIGEKILSIKQLLNKPSRLWRTTSGNESAFYIWPWLKSTLMIDSGTGVLQVPKTGGDPYNLFSAWYLYMRGGIKLIVSTDGSKPMYVSTTYNNNIINPSATSATWSSATYDITPGVATWTNSTVANNVSVAIQSGDVGSVAVEIPYMSLCQATILPSTTGYSGDNFNGNITCPNTGLNFIQADATKVALFRSVSDSFQFSYFLGTVPIMVNYV